MNVQLNLFEIEETPKKRAKQPKLYNCPQATKMIRKVIAKPKHSRVLSALVKLGYVKQEENKYSGFMTLEQVNEAIKYMESLK